jgi:hypothetical protein
VPVRSLEKSQQTAAPTKFNWQEEARKLDQLFTKTLRGTDLYRLVAPSVYYVAAKTEDKTVSFGSAVAISTSTLITNCHVIAGSEWLGAWSPVANPAPGSPR